jgi:RNAse (barnase) inhibitor barstar
MARLTEKQKFLKLLEKHNIDKNDPDVLAAVEEAEGDYSELTTKITAATTELDTVKNLNTKWGEWYKERGSKVDEYEATLSKLKAAGFNVDGTHVEDEEKPKGSTPQYITPEQLAAERDQIFNTVSAVNKAIMTHSLKYVKDFGEVPDLDAIEKLIAEKRLPVDVAFKEFAAPKIEAKNKEDFEKEVARRVKEQLADERSQKGVQGKNNRKDSLFAAMVEKKKEAPDYYEQLDAFSDALNSTPPETAH